MTKDWLIKKVERSEADAELGMDNPRWVEFRGKLLGGDELWFFSSPMKFWRNKCGRSGYSIVRDEVIIESFLTMMN